jgi:hypothetical protein
VIEPFLLVAVQRVVVVPAGLGGGRA